MNLNHSLDNFYDRPISKGKYREYKDFSYTKLDRIGKGARKIVWAASFANGYKAVLKETIRIEDLKEIVRYLKVIQTLKGHPSIAETEKTFFTNAKHRGLKFFQIQTLYSFDLVKAVNNTFFHDNPVLVLVAFRQLADGLCYIHEKGVVVNDIKLDNMYVKYSLNEVQFVYGDFGGADLKNDFSSIRVTSERYASPQALENCSKRKEEDIFSLGICFAAIQKVSKGMEFPLEILRRKKVLFKQAIDLFCKNFVVSPFDSLIPQMLSVNESKRPSAALLVKKVREIKRHRRSGSCLS